MLLRISTNRPVRKGRFLKPVIKPKVLLVEDNGDSRKLASLFHTAGKERTEMNAAIKLKYDPQELALELNLRERTAALIVALRTESGLTYEEIAAKASISKEKLVSWETGAKSPLLLEVANLARHCDMSAAANFNLGFNKLLREAQTRIAELQKSSPQQPAPLCVRRENFAAIGAVGGIHAAS